jgi:hypothetical protein
MEVEQSFEALSLKTKLEKCQNDLAEISIADKSNDYKLKRQSIVTADYCSIQFIVSASKSSKFLFYYHPFNLQLVANSSLCGVFKPTSKEFKALMSQRNIF